MNILYIAASCSPTLGSESKIGWNVPLESAKTNNVFVITKGGARAKIAAYLDENPNNRLHFYYVDIPRYYNKIFKGAFYSGILNIWHRHAYSVAKEICEKEKIDVIHQITPIEFRSIGDYWKIPNTKFVVGPLGGGEYIPKGLRGYATRHCIVEGIRIVLNYWHKLGIRLSRKFKKCDCVLFANAETAAFLCRGGQTHTETAIHTDEIMQNARHDNATCTFLVAGRLIYRKGTMFLLDALERLPREYSYQCRIVGRGAERTRLERRVAQSATLKEHIVFVGSVSYEDMRKEYQQSDVLLFPSLRETTGFVILEAMGYGLPVVTINAFGGGKIVNNDTGWLYSGSNKEEYITNLAAAIKDCIDHPDVVRRKRAKAQQEIRHYSWAALLTYYNAIYRRVLTS